MRRPSQRSIDLYNQLVAQQNKVRKQLRKLHKKAEETLGAGRLPALVIPKSARKIRMHDFQGLTPEQLHARLRAYWKAYQEKKALFGKGLKSYLARTVMQGYLELWQGKDGIGEEPEGSFGRYSKEQIENSDKGEFMQLYNQLFTRGPEFFLALLYTGRVVAFKEIYDEIRGLGRGYRYVEQQADMLSIYASPKARTKLMEEAEKITGYKHSKAVMKRVDNKDKNVQAKRNKGLDAVASGGVDID